LPFFMSPLSAGEIERGKYTAAPAGAKPRAGQPTPDARRANEELRGSDEVLRDYRSRGRATALTTGAAALIGLPENSAVAACGSAGAAADARFVIRTFVIDSDFEFRASGFPPAPKTLLPAIDLSIAAKTIPPP
jgi:hypothetical protein